MNKHDVQNSISGVISKPYSTVIIENIAFSSNINADHISVSNGRHGDFIQCRIIYIHISKYKGNNMYIVHYQGMDHSQYYDIESLSDKVLKIISIWEF